MPESETGEMKLRAPGRQKKICEICEITRNSERIRTYSRSVIQGHLGVNRKRICDFPLVINSNLDASSNVFEILTFKARKWLVYPTRPLFDAPARWSLIEFLTETYPTKTTGMRLPYGENFIILTFQPFLADPSVLQTDAVRTDRRAGDSIVWHSSTSTYTSNFVQIGKAFCGRADIETSSIRSTLSTTCIDMLLTIHFRLIMCKN